MKRRSWGLVFRNAAEGIAYGLRTQRNVRVHTGVAILMCAAGFFQNLKNGLDVCADRCIFGPGD